MMSLVVLYAYPIIYVENLDKEGSYIDSACYAKEVILSF